MRESFSRVSLDGVVWFGAGNRDGSGRFDRGKMRKL